MDSLERIDSLMQRELGNWVNKLEIDSRLGDVTNSARRADGRDLLVVHCLGVRVKTLSSHEDCAAQE